MSKSAKEYYIGKAKNLTYKEVEQVLTRMREKPTPRKKGEKISPLDAIAIQLELDDELLAK